MSLFFATLLQLSPVLFDASQAVSRDPLFTAWGECIVEGAGALSNAPDAADLVADAALFSCEDDEAGALTVSFRETSTREDALAVHAYLRDRMRKRAIAVIINRRAMRNISD